VRKAILQPATRVQAGVSVYFQAGVSVYFFGFFFCLRFVSVARARLIFCFCRVLGFPDFFADG